MAVVGALIVMQILGSMPLQANLETLDHGLDHLDLWVITRYN